MSLLPVFKMFEGETVYSVVSRYHAISGLFNHNTLVSNVFDVNKKRIHPYLPNALEKFSHYFEESLHLTINNRTLFPIFDATLKSPQSSKLYRSILGENGSPFHLSMTPQYGLKLFAGHKYCPECASHDLITYGTSYWHIEHQIPGMTACVIHHCLLEGIRNDDLHLDRRLSLPLFVGDSQKANKVDVLFSEFSIRKFQEYKQEHFQRESIDTITQNLKTLGFITQSGQLKYEQLTTELRRFWKGLSANVPLGIPVSVQSFDFVGPMLRVKTRTPAHPLKYFLVLCWMENLNKESRHYPNIPCNSKSNFDKDILKLAEAGQSMNSIEKTLGISRCYIRKLLELNGIHHESNSMHLPDEIIRKVVIKGFYGYTIEEISTQLSLKPSTIEHIFCRTKGMSLWRKKLRHQKKLDSALTVLKSAVKAHPDWLRKDIKKHYNAEFFMIYNHDKLMLEDILPAKTSPIPPKSKRKRP